MRWLALLFLFPLAVAAEQVAVASDGGDSIELHDRVHQKCAKGVSEAVYVHRQGIKIDGCWKYIIDRDAIFIVFEDGDSFLIPTNKFTWKRGKKPAAL